LNGLLIVFGLPFIVVGIGIIASPPKSKLSAEENKGRNGILLLIGFMIAIFEVYFFNKALGFW
jgi:hypothetical protein